VERFNDGNDLNCQIKRYIKTENASMSNVNYPL